MLSVWEHMRSCSYTFEASLKPESVKIDVTSLIETLININFEHTAALDNLNFVI